MAGSDVRIEFEKVGVLIFLGRIAKFLVEGAAWLRGLVALSAWLVVFRALDLARLPGPMWSPARRVWHLRAGNHFFRQPNFRQLNRGRIVAGRRARRRGGVQQIRI